MSKAVFALSSLTNQPYSHLIKQIASDMPLTPIYLLKEEKLNSLTIRIGFLMFVVYGLTCLVSLLHKNFVYW